MMQSPGASSPSHRDTNLDSSFMSSSSDAHKSQTPMASQDSERRRRKRTTAQDKAVLETAYQRDTKPDKQARLDMVSRVSMSEKEVQIWFQNRRQNDRRKTRPLSIHEVESLRYRSAGVHIAASSSKTADPRPVQDHHHFSAVQQHLPPYDPVHASCREEETQQQQQQQSSTPPEQAAVLPQPRSTSSSPRDTLPPPPLPASSAPAPLPSPQASQSTDTDPDLFFSSFSTSTCSQESPDGTGYLSNRRNADSFSSSSSRPTTTTTFSRHLALPSLNPNATRPRPPLSQLLNDKPSNPFKITLSLEGKAELAPTISPPRPHHHRPYSPYDPELLTRRLAPRLNHPHAHAHPGCGTVPTSLPPISSLLNMNCCGVPPRLGRGSSRDAHAWEQVADTSDPTPTTVADSLTTQADDEVSGSARAAISLIRQQSSSSSSGVVADAVGSSSSGLAPPATAAAAAPGILANNNGKRNATTASHNARGGKKAKLGLGGRATAMSSSSLARLERTPERPGPEAADSHHRTSSRVVAAAETRRDKEEENTDNSSRARTRPRPRPRTTGTRTVEEDLDLIIKNNKPIKGGSEEDLLFLGSPADSEKENWSPDSAGIPRPHRRRPVAAAAAAQPSRGVLEEAGGRKKVLEDSSSIMPSGGGGGGGGRKRLFFVPPPPPPPLSAAAPPPLTHHRHHSSSLTAGERKGGGKKRRATTTTTLTTTTKSPRVSIFEDIRTDDDDDYNDYNDDDDEEDGDEDEDAAGVMVMRRGGSSSMVTEDAGAAHSFDPACAVVAVVAAGEQQQQQEEEDEEELERFMRGDVSPSKKGDADAVHGLLSLKGGGWHE